MTNTTAHRTICLYIPLHDTLALCEQINTLEARSHRKMTTTKKRTNKQTKLFYPLTVCKCKDDLTNQRQIFLHPNTLGRFWMSGQQMFLLPCWPHKLCAHNRVTNFVVFPSLLVCELRPFQRVGQKCSGERRRRKLFADVYLIEDVH